MAENRIKGSRVLVLLWLVALAGVAFVLLADPFGNDEESDEEQIVAAIERAATSTDPAYCRDAVTPAYLEQRTGFGGRAAIADCIAFAEDGTGVPSVVTVEDLEIDGETAAARVRHHGGAFSGALLSLELVEDDGWRLDRLERIDDLDRAVYARLYREQLLAPPFAFAPATARCMTERVVLVPIDELEASLVDVDPLRTTRAAVACDREAVEQLTATTFAHADYGLSTAEFDCAMAAVATTSDPELAGLYARPASQRELLASCEQGA